MEFFKTFSGCSHLIDFSGFHFFVRKGVAHVRYNSLYLDKQDLRFACSYYYELLLGLCPHSVVPFFNLDCKSLTSHDLVVYFHGLLSDYAKLSGLDTSFLNEGFNPSIPLKFSRLPHGVLRSSRVVKTFHVSSVYDIKNNFLGLLCAEKFYKNRALLLDALSSSYPPCKYIVSVVYDDALPF